MDIVFLRKAFALIAKGIVEKEELLQKEPTRYPYSKTLQHGINMFLAASFYAGGGKDWVKEYADESAFLENFITRPIAEWFNDWNKDVIEDLKIAEESFYWYKEFARKTGNSYIPSADCEEFLEIQDYDIVGGNDQHFLYEQMSKLDQDSYCEIRRYIIEKPIITIKERQEMSLKLAGYSGANEAFQFAYEEITEECYRCPCCGWTMIKGKYGCRCHSPHCVDIIPELTDKMKLDASSKELYRLKKGIMSYIAAPGKLELDIAAFCKERNIEYLLWPNMDRYDIEIHFSEKEIWEVDAKMYRNPRALREKIQKDNGFPNGRYERGFVVVPNEYTRNQNKYIKIVNEALEKQKNVKCVTFSRLKTEIEKRQRR